jgi:hypothetical protein
MIVIVFNPSLRTFLSQGLILLTEFSKLIHLLKALSQVVVVDEVFPFTVNIYTALFPCLTQPVIGW